MEPSAPSRSRLFTLRVWQEEVGVDQVEWRGRVQLVSRGDVRYFRQWEALAPLLQSMLADATTLSTIEDCPEHESPEQH
ncbi:hypothetical protein [Dictyobacter kobayashii]|uniref:Uncharacterized protein n=1 Tax=Dictyobacter kobayashii TaxID=2014872 RepID=A0A402AYP0_9CHLR|nr:hypothetical protein [Dictyobacter kobayashii]GCE24222.1 hypothetical protein KDK_80220 [Dictyobacter kobayashii]